MKGNRVGWMGAGLVVLVTLIVLVVSPVRQWMVEASYDWLFRLRPTIDVKGDPVVIVAMDHDSGGKLDQPSEEAWNRGLHGQLLDKLRESGVRVVAFDVFFRGDRSEDTDLLAAAAKHGKVIFAAIVDVKKDPTGELRLRVVEKPFSSRVPDGELGIVENSRTTMFRRHQNPERNIPALAWRAAESTVAELPSRNGERWINYYGPKGEVQRIGYASVLSNDIPEGVTLEGATVFVGAVARVGPTGGSGADYFQTPFGTEMPGVEIIATVHLNLSRGDWLRRTDGWFEFLVLLIGGVGWGFGMTRLRPLVATGVTVSAAVLIVCFMLLLHSVLLVWFPWMLICGVQLPVALGWSVLMHTRRLDEQRHELEEEKVALQQELATAMSARTALSGPVIPDVTLLRCVGKGAYGEVWLGRDVVGNFRAVKIIYRATFSSDVPFEREFKGIERFSPLSRSHPGWVDVLHIGRNDEKQYFFYIMEPADDIRLGQAIEAERYEPKTLQAELDRRGRFEMKESLDLALALASALEHLHRHGLVHRDIKPANVIFVNGQPKFVDIGLITETAGTREDVSWIGTEGYMPPEGPGAPSADVYGLGKLIYEVSMGRDRRAFPELPTVVLDSEPGDSWDQLNSIILTACEADVSKRYQSAAALHAELLRLHGGL